MRSAPAYDLAMLLKGLLSCTLAVGVAMCVSVSSILGQKIVKDVIRSQGKVRAYYLFVPDKLDQSRPAPLIIMLHGSGHTGDSLVKEWTRLAKKEGIIIVGPDSLDPASWAIPADAPDPLHDLIEALKSKYPVDPKRVYLFGHSAGAVSGLYVALMESQYFAAAAIHAGAMQPKDTQFIDTVKRKIPIAIWVGTNDSFFPLAKVRATRDLLTQHGMSVGLTEMKGRTHNYYEHAEEVNKWVWDFLKGNSLDADPKYEQYMWEQVE